MQTDVPANKTRRGLPIAALLFGLIGLLEIGWMWMENIKARPCGKPLTEHYFSIPSLLGFMLGLTAIIKNNLNTPVSSGEDVRAAIRTGGKRLAILGVIAGAPGLLLTIASLPSCGAMIDHFRESAAIQTLRTIHNCQEQYFATLSRFATLGELAASGMVDAEYASGRPISGYVYSASDITAKTYCVHAARANDKCGSRDFIVCEDGIIRFIESENKGAVRRGEGQPIGAPH
jgi:Tfp pilus assembly protein PilE